MKTETVEKIANAVLYEGYMLYPYRASAIKNRQRFNFGVLYPREHCDLQQGSDTCEMQTECLVLADNAPSLEAAVTIQVKARFLQMIACKDRQEGIERDVSTPACDLETIAAAPYRQFFGFEPLTGELELAATRINDTLYKITLAVRNCAALDDPDARDREDMMLRSLVSVHSILQVDGGSFISSIDPPEGFREAAAQCRNQGTYPVLVGEEGQRDMMLSSPIILYDYPQIAPESAGDLFDGTEIDEILALRILTMTDEEKLEVRNGDERARLILERTEALPAEHFQKLHGALRGLQASSDGAGGAR
jgi:hypothetical protein